MGASAREITFALRWETVEVDETPTPIELPSHRVQPTRATRGGLQQRGIEIELPLPGEERYRIYHVSGEHGALDSGVRSEWVTAKP
jgi:hypothetical protein